jgi:hypothetical protein
MKTFNSLFTSFILHPSSLSLLLLSSFILLPSSLQATAVLFPLKSMFPAQSWNKEFLITARYPLLTDGTNFYSGTVLLVKPNGGTNPIVQLRPNEYTVTFPDSRTSLRIYVPNTNTVQSALNLTTNIWSYYYTNVVIGSGSGNTTGFTGTVTNQASTITVITTNDFAGVFIQNINNANEPLLYGHYLKSVTNSQVFFQTNNSGRVLYYGSFENAYGPNVTGYGINADAGNYAFTNLTGYYAQMYDGYIAQSLLVSTYGDSLETNTFRSYSLITFTNGVCSTNRIYIPIVAETFNGVHIGSGAGLTNVPTASPFKIVSLTAPANGDTNWFGPWTPGTTTAGIQEAVNSLPVAGQFYEAGGGVVHIGVGIFKLGQAVVMPPAVSNGFSLTIQGQGNVSSVLLATNTVPHSVFKLEPNKVTNSITFQLYDTLIAGVTNAATNLLHLDGRTYWDGASYDHGRFARADIRRNLFAWWGTLTNRAGGGWNIRGLTPDHANETDKPHNLTAIYYNNNLGDYAAISENQFTFVQGVVLANDHLIFTHNAFEGCGTWVPLIGGASITNAWPDADPRATGAAAILGAQNANNDQAWDIGYNFFVNHAVSYLWDCYFTNETNWKWSIGDQFETLGPTHMTTGVKVTPFGNRWGYTRDFREVTNTNFRLPWKANTDKINEASVQDGFQRFVFNATNRLNVFKGHGGGLYQTNAAGAKFELIVNSTTNGFIFVPVP